MQNIVLQTPEEIAQEECLLISTMANTEGWRSLKKWINEEIEDMIGELLLTDIEEVDMIRGRINGLKLVLIYVEECINKINKQ
jgi:hypothetical protein